MKIGRREQEQGGVKFTRGSHRLFVHQVMDSILYAGFEVWTKAMFNGNNLEPSPRVEHALRRPRSGHLPIAANPSGNACQSGSVQPMGHGQRFNIQLTMHTRCAPIRAGPGWRAGWRRAFVLTLGYHEHPSHEIAGGPPKCLPLDSLSLSWPLWTFLLSIALRPPEFPALAMALGAWPAASAIGGRRFQARL
jgi:hypothetical protein